MEGHSQLPQKLSVKIRSWVQGKEIVHFIADGERGGIKKDDKVKRVLKSKHWGI